METKLNRFILENIYEYVPLDKLLKFQQLDKIHYNDYIPKIFH